MVWRLKIEDARQVFSPNLQTSAIGQSTVLFSLFVYIYTYIYIQILTIADDVWYHTRRHIVIHKIEDLCVHTYEYMYVYEYKQCPVCMGYFVYIYTWHMMTHIHVYIYIYISLAYVHTYVCGRMYTGVPRNEYIIMTYTHKYMNIRIMRHSIGA